MLTHIDHALHAWGRWAVRHASKGVGWPTVSPMFRDYRSSNVYGSCEPIGTLAEADCHDIDKAVGTLPSVLRITVIEYYQFCNGNWSKSTKRLGISRETLSKYLDRARRMVAAHLAENKKN